MDQAGYRSQLLLALKSLRAHVEYLSQCGVEGFPLPDGAVRMRAASPKDRGRPAAARGEADPPPQRGTLPAGAVRDGAPWIAPPVSGQLFLSPGVRGARTLEELRAEIGDCRRCRLCESRTNLVFGVGNPKAELVFVGEGPGQDEDRQGEPFVGRAGQLLTEIITKGMGLSREQVYIANVIKCRPPGNRNPEADEIAACEPFLLKQLEVIGPKVIVALGTFAAQTLLRTRAPITRLRGAWHAYHGMKLMPTFHPAYLLRNPHDKKLVWNDIQEVMRELGLRPTGRGSSRR